MDIVASAVFIGVKHVSRNERNAHIVGAVDKVLAVHAVRQAAPDVHAAPRLFIAHAEMRERIEFLAHKVAVAAVDLAECGKRAIIAPVVQIHAEELLRHPVRGHQPHRDKIAQRTDEIAVARDEGKAQPRNEGEGERIDVNDISRCVKRFDRRELIAVVDELARRVLLHDRNAVAAGKLHELLAPLERQNAARGVVEA